MNLIIESNDMDDYLKETEEINFSHNLIKEKANVLYKKDDVITFIKATFEYVRDHISHSWDIQSSRVTYKASDVLLYKEGICYAKSLLLCALLRSKGVPTGFCYQRLTLGDTPKTGYAIHALNAVYICSLKKWIRLDARGNNAEVNALFSIEEEKLAFPVRIHYDEIDYPTIYKCPNIETISILKQASNCLEMYKNHLPTCLQEGTL